MARAAVKLKDREFTHAFIKPLSRAVGVTDAAKRLGISRSHLYDLISEGKVKSIKVGRRRLLSDNEIERITNEGA